MEDEAVSPCSIELRPGTDLGMTRAGGLSGRHHFCFATYQRPDRVQWGALRVLNQYRLEAGSPRTPTFHAGFEILTLVKSGRLRRTGTFRPGATLVPGSAELVSAGTGADLGVEAISGDTDYLELWIEADPPLGRARREFRPVAARDLIRPLAAGPRREEGALLLRAQARVHSLALRAGESATLAIGEELCAYAVVLRGAVAANGTRAAVADGLAIRGGGRLALHAESGCDLLLIRTRKRA